MNSAVLNTECEIDLMDNVPFRLGSYQFTPPKVVVLKTEIYNLLAVGVIRPSRSNFVSPAFLVNKPNSGHRLVVDYCKLNKKFVFNCFPLPTLESAFHHLGNAKIFSVIDLQCAHFQIPHLLKAEYIRLL